MPRYEVYLEIHSDGRTMAHVPALPGCMVRRESRAEALRCLGDAVKEHQAWLRSHAEPAPGPDALSEIVVVEERSGIGAFERRAAAALLPPDLAPVNDKELAYHLRLLDHAREDLLALVSGLPENVLDWRPAAGQMNIREVLQHIGGADLWYLSRLYGVAELDRLSASALPLFEYLQQTRQYARERLAAFPQDGRAKMYESILRDGQPDEPWTLRKALRRAIEHELEHTSHIRDLLVAQRMRLIARLMLRRAELLDQLTGLPAETLGRVPVFGDSAPAHILAHIASWDEFFAARLAAVRAGHASTITSVDVDARNAMTASQRKNWGLDRALAAFIGARQNLLAELVEVSVVDLFKPLPLTWGSPSIAQWVEICVDHDEEHAADLAKWRGTLGCEAQETWRRRGAKPVLEFALGARREALLAYLALIPPTKQDSRAVWANWTSKDLVGHLADWEREAIERINAMLEDREPASEYTGDVEAWNMARYSAHTGQSWEAVWNDFRATRRDLMALLRRTDDTALEVRHEGDQGLTPYGWFFMAVDHDREHTGDLIRLLDSDISPEDGPEKGPA